MKMHENKLEEIEEFSGKIRRIFANNGWQYVANDSDFSFFELVITHEYEITVRACVSYDMLALGACGDFGVVWLEVVPSHGDGFSHRLMACEIEEMYEAILAAEDNLLTIGIPFTERTRQEKFYGSNVSNRIHRNTALRKKFRIPDLLRLADANW